MTNWHDDIALLKKSAKISLNSDKKCFGINFGKRRAIIIIIKKWEKLLELT